jgi:hypothetical protein
MLFTKDGRPLTFTLQKDIEGENRGWQLDIITAFLDGEEAGYLKISYIPKHKFDAHYPTIFHWFNFCYGALCFPHDFDPYAPLLPGEGYFQNFTAPQKRDILTRIKSTGTLYQYDIHTKLEMCEDEDLDALMTFVENILMAEKYHDAPAQRYKRFKNSVMNKPGVDYIRTENLTSHSETKHKFTRNHIGLSLYKAGALYCHSQKMKLWAGGPQTDKAKSVWKKMKTLGWVSHSKGRLYFDVPAYKRTQVKNTKVLFDTEC